MIGPFRISSATAVCVVWGAVFGAAIAVAPLTGQVTPSQQTSEIFGFNCNAGNACSPALMEAFRSGPVTLDAVLDECTTQYNGSHRQALRLVLVRVRGREVVAYGVSDARVVEPGQVISTERFGYPREEGLIPDRRTRITRKQHTHVTEHVDAGRFMEAIEAGGGERVLAMLGMRGVDDALVIATIPGEERVARSDEPFTMHPLVIEISA